MQFLINTLPRISSVKADPPIIGPILRSVALYSKGLTNECNLYIYKMCHLRIPPIK